MLSVAWTGAGPDGYWVSDDKALLDTERVHGWMQVGFARVVTDYATFCWLCDVFVDVAHRGKGAGTFLVEAALGHPHVAGLRTVLMAAPGRSLSLRLGFGGLISPERWMERPSSPR